MTRWEYSSNFIFVVRSSLPPRRLLDSRLRRNVRGGPVQRAQRGLSRRRGGTERKGGFPAIVNRPFTTVVFDFVLLHLLSPCLSGSVRGLAFDRSSAAGGRGPEIGSPRSSRRARRGQKCTGTGASRHWFSIISARNVRMSGHFCHLSGPVRGRGLCVTCGGAGETLEFAPAGLVVMSRSVVASTRSSRAESGPR